MVTIVVIVIVLIGGYFLFGMNSKSTSSLTSGGGELNTAQQTNTVAEPTAMVEPSTTETGKTYEVMYTDSGYSPKEITIKVGDTVTWKNQSSRGDWVGSAMHPTHVVYSGTSLDEHCPDIKNTSFDECKSDQPGNSWSFTFNKKGKWYYHNHVNAHDFGSVIVE